MNAENKSTKNSQLSDKEIYTHYLDWCHRVVTMALEAGTEWETIAVEDHRQQLWEYYRENKQAIIRQMRKEYGIDVPYDAVTLECNKVH